MQRLLGLTFAVGLLLPSALHAATLVHWEADDTPGAGGANSAAATSVAANIVASDFTLSSGTNTIQSSVASTNSSLSGDPVFRTSGWDIPINTATPTKFYAFGVDVTGANAVGDNSMTLDEVRFHSSHSAAGRSIDYQLDFSTDGTIFTTADSGTFTDDAAGGIQWEEFVVDLSPFSLENVMDTVSFRLYLGNISGNSGATFAVDDIQIVGDVVEAVPEPASVAIWTLLGFIGVAFAMRRRRS